MNSASGLREKPQSTLQVNPAGLPATLDMSPPLEGQAMPIAAPRRRWLKNAPFVIALATTGLCLWAVDGNSPWSGRMFSQFMPVKVATVTLAIPAVSSARPSIVK